MRAIVANRRSRFAAPAGGGAGGGRRYNTRMIAPPAPDRIDPARLAARLDARARDWRIEVVDATGSTSADLLEQLRDARPLSTPQVRAAHLQTAGRGRRGRTWLAAPGDALLFSVGYPLGRPADGLAGLSLAAGTAVIAGLRALALPDASRRTLKWPNDVLLDGGKLAGILIETAWSDTRTSAAVIGVGVNLRGGAALAERIAALDGEVGAAVPAALDDALPGVDMTEVFAHLLNALADALGRFGAEGFAPFREIWNADHAHAGQPVVLLDRGVEHLTGIARGVDAQGRLLIDAGAGGLRPVASGDVSLRPLPRRDGGFGSNR